MKFKLLTILLFTLVSCIKTEPDIIKRYIHISHTRTEANPFLMREVEEKKFNQFDIIMLGGDMALLSSEDDETMERIDSIFNVSNPSTLWSLGNHDYSDLNRIQNFTKRPAFYTFSKNRITFIVFDTMDSLETTLKAQQKLFEDVVDTLSNSKYLILLFHKLNWLNDNGILQASITKTTNANYHENYDACPHCINPNNFYSEVYPKLIEVEKKGIEVICIGGDIGLRIKEYSYLSKEGIQFLASGMWRNSQGNKVLVFNHNLTKDSLGWQFVSINEL